MRRGAENEERIERCREEVMAVEAGIVKHEYIRVGIYEEMKGLALSFHLSRLV